MIGFLIKGLLRDRTRSLFPVLMVCAGTFLTVCAYSFINGVAGDIVDTSARFDAGHVKVTTRAYQKAADQLPNDLALLGAGGLLSGLERDYPQMRWAPRIRFGGLLDIPDTNGETRAQGPVLGLGVDLLDPGSREIQTLNLEKALVRGRLPEREREALLSETFARRLKLDLDQTATLLGSTMNGAMAFANFKVVGAVNFGLTALDRSVMIADLEDVRTALDMADGAGEIVGYSRDMVFREKDMAALAREFNGRYASEKGEFAPLMVSLKEQGGLAEYLDMMDLGGLIIVAVFVFAMSLVLWNAGLMNGIRRYGEIGVRMALGESKGALYRAMVFEAAALGLVGAVLGTALGLALSYWFQYVGLDLSGSLKNSTVMISSVVRARVSPGSYLIGFIPGVGASVLGTVFAGVGIYRRQTAQLFKELET